MNEKSNIDEKLYFTATRMSQLNSNRHPSNNIPNERLLEYKLEAEKRFGNFLFVPLDIPVIKDDLFVEWYWENAKSVKKVSSDIATHRTDLESFVSVDVAEPGSWVLGPKNPFNYTWGANYRTDFSKLFPRLTEQLYEYFPVKSIDSYSIWSSIETIGAHRDDSIFLDFPSSFRIMLYDDNPAPTLHVEEYKSNNDIPEPNTKKYVPRLEDTNSFVWSNLRTKHGSDFHPGNRKILLRFRFFLIDWEKYFSLMDRSIIKYSDHCLKSNLNLNDFINQ
jgi:hypothetical protein